MTFEENLKRWNRILDTKYLHLGDAIKFKWSDLRSTESSKRKTWTNGEVTDIMAELGYHVRVVKGGPIRDDVLVTFKEARIWCPRKK